MLIESAMAHDTQKHTCTRCEQTSRGVDWQPLLGAFTHYECWLEIARDNVADAIKGKRQPPGRPRLARAIFQQMDLFGETPGD